MSKLQISPTLALPAQAITETFALLAVRGAGKTNAARVLAEEMFAAKLPFVAVDPVGSWYGLRSSRDGKRPGLAVPIFGGKHGDVPLERGGGQLLADLVVDQRLSCVLDLSRFDSEASKKTFLLDFARRLYLRNEEPLHLFLEEADDYIPQRPMRDEAHLLRAWENIVRRGRARGIGVTLITQRSASINKSVLTQVQTLIAMRTTGPQDRAAIEDWLKYHAQSREILESLASLESGEAWVWSPQFLKKTARIRFRLSETLDSGETPKAHRGERPTTTLADVDLEGVRARMAETIERAKAEDPRELRKKIAELERQAAAKPAAAPAPKPVEVPVFTPQELKRLEAAVARLEKVAGAVEDAGASCVAMVKDLRGVIWAKQNPPAATSRVRPMVPTPSGGSAPARRWGLSGNAVLLPPAASSSLPPGERAILTAAAQYDAGVARDQLSVLTGYKRSSRDAYIQRLRGAGFIEERGGQIVATAAGVAALGPEFQPLPTGLELRAHWLERLPEGEAKILGVLIEAHPHAIAREKLDETTGYKRSSRDAYLQRLKARRLIEHVGRGLVLASSELF